MIKINFKLNGVYSGKAITRQLCNLVTSGEAIGGVHIIENESYKFVMLNNGAWRGGSSYFYKLVEIK